MSQETELLLRVWGEEGDDGQEPEAKTPSLEEVAAQVARLSQEAESREKILKEREEEIERLKKNQDRLIGDLQKKGQAGEGSVAQGILNTSEVKKQIAELKEENQRTLKQALAAKDAEHRKAISKLVQDQEENARQLAEMRVMNPFRAQLKAMVHDPEDLIKITGITSRDLVAVGEETYVRGEASEKAPDGELQTITTWLQKKLHNKRYMLKGHDQDFFATPQTIGSDEPAPANTSTSRTKNPFVRGPSYDPWGAQQLQKQKPEEARVLQNQARAINAANLPRK